MQPDQTCAHYQNILDIKEHWNFDLLKLKICWIRIEEDFAANVIPISPQEKTRRFEWGEWRTNFQGRCFEEECAF